MLDRLEQLEQQATAELKAVGDADALEQFRIRYLGAKGQLKAAMSWLKDASKEDKPKLGQGLNALKKKLEAAFEARQSELGSSAGAKASGRGPMLDVTEPGLAPTMGRAHVIEQVMAQLIEVFARMGFDVAEGPELEDERHNFVALNIPMQHPARDPLDNFYVDDSHLLRTQTSTIQIRVMEHTQPPIRIVAPGRVYRPDTHDATHSSMFHQIEGLYVDRKVSMVDLKTTLINFAHAFFGEEAEVRLRPSYFPFTEPSAELDIKMQVKDTWDWVELGGCGMVDPAVFEAVGYDPDEWTGFAFGLGVERIAMRRYGISDIRWLYENDVRFLKQF
ncbi:phenylalanine--tRNA ligase subunit alpha [Planctomycetales bacterium ZRK34]|nr:phenylalanine--tRNA ligase subunit alpha [Planctomycetales bacterium ZRK34]